MQPVKLPKRFKTIWIGLISLALLAELAYFLFQNNIHKLLQSFNLNKESSSSALDQQKKVLDCAKKIDQSQDLSSLNSQEVRDCLFVGCGNFFR